MSNSNPDDIAGLRDKPRVLVTGASGFVGQAVCRILLSSGWTVYGQGFRNPVPPGCIPLHANLGQNADLSASLPAVEAIVHLAGLAHVPADRLERTAIWRTNVEATQSLARFAAQLGAHFIYLSTAKVLGESGEWNDDSAPAPGDAYAESKLAAETMIRAEPDSRYTILRPPLVYGPHVRGNFLSLLRLAHSGWPLPLASLNNPRSLIFVDNLAAAILACLQNPVAASRNTWLVSDGGAMQVATLFRHLANALGRPARLFPLGPEKLLLLARLVGRPSAAEKLIGHFVVHDAGIRRGLNWSPPHTYSSALRKTADWFLSQA